MKQAFKEGQFVELNWEFDNIVVKITEIDVSERGLMAVYEIEGEGSFYAYFDQIRKVVKGVK